MTVVENALVARAAALMELGRNDEAKEVLGRRLAEDPDDRDALVTLARCHLDARTFQGTVDATDRVLALDPDDHGALVVRTYGLRRLGRPEEAEIAARAAIRVSPESWRGHAALSEAVGAYQPRWPETLEAAAHAVRLAPEEPFAHYTMWKAALLNGRGDIRRQAVLATLRIDPDDAWALEEHAALQAADPSKKLPEVADGYATALAADPSSRSLRSGLDRTVFRMLRGTRWIALLCVVLAGVAVDLFPADGEAKDLPLPIGTRLYAIALMGVAWGFGAWRRYRRLRTGVRLSVRSLVRREFWARLVLGQAVWSTLCGLLVAAVPWTDRGIPQVLFWAGLIPTLLTIWFERAALRS
ncbi:tetratricopeptide repeat protein [Streptomyces sp. NPDC056987]|uniref:tetratricopeptide repeat protein n=1 Tax=Streptomyces sp. NPDC056987 TaxID=3345988 RepID=UPI0036313FC2